MWVQLNIHGHSLLRGIYRLDEPMTDAFTRQVDKPRPAVVHVRAPYAAWYNAQRALRSRAFGPRGGKVQKKESLFTCLRAITREVNYVDTHPAFVNKAFPGWLGEEYPAWETGDPSRPWTPYPRPGSAYVLLAPSWEWAGDMKVTIWRSATPRTDDWLHDEATHLRLWRQPEA